MAGYPVVGIKATLTDGSYHPVDSSEMAFKMASTLAFKEGFMKASPVILEPIASLSVTVPDAFTGDVMGAGSELAEVLLLLVVIVLTKYTGMTPLSLFPF